MNDKGKAIIILESKTDGEQSTFRYKGDWFRKDKSLFIRYTEEGDSRALIRYTPGELSLKRSGSVQSEQLFVAGQRRVGQYRSAAAAFQLEADTKILTMRAKAKGDEGAVLPARPPFTLEWRYDLYVSEQMSGRFHIRLHIQEDHE